MYFKLEYEYTLDQNKIYSENNTETSTASYSLLNFGLGSDVLSKNQKPLFSFYFNVSNIFDEAYQNHLSRLKYAPVNYATGRTGIYNMGRNFSFKLVVPLRIQKSRMQ
jgi:iron complex outermembrane receptor protein